MRVKTRTPVIPLPELQPAIDAVLGARLIARDDAPVMVAFSGGGDSLALLLAAQAWATGRRLVALTVDHGLNPRAGAWADFCRERAARLGVAHRTLVWSGEKPLTGVSAAARAARHRLLADAARQAGAAVILMGHTLDDDAEAGLMRLAGSSVSSPRVWSPSPAWPEGRGVFLLRPLLGVRRAALRSALTALGERWIDDPANVDPCSARARARTLLCDRALAAPAERPCPCGLALGAEEGPAGDLTFPLGRLVGSSDAEALLSAALLCAAGTARPPRRDRLLRLLARIGGGERFAATLAGARVESDGGRVHIVRDAGDSRRSPAGDVLLPLGRQMVWDGRFECSAAESDAMIGALAGHAASLPPLLRRAARTVPPVARRALPMILRMDGSMALPTLLPTASAHVRPLALARLAAARGSIASETALRAWRNSRSHPKWED